MARRERGDPLLFVLRTNVEAGLHRLGRTQTDLADYCGHSRAWISRILQGHRGFRIVDLAAIARFLGLSVPQLFEIDGVAWQDRRRGQRRGSQGDRRSGQDRRLRP